MEVFVFIYTIINDYVHKNSFKEHRERRIHFDVEICIRLCIQASLNNPIAFIKFNQNEKVFFCLLYRDSSTDVNGSKDELIMPMPRERVLKRLPVPEEDDLLDLDD